MIAYGDVEKLRSSHAPDASVLSLYVYVPPDRTLLRDLPLRVIDLITDADAADPGRLRREDDRQARRAVVVHARDWLGYTLGVFASEQLGLLEIVPTRGYLTERAVLASRPHLRPLLAALQRHPDHRIVIIDHRHAWLLAVTGDRIEVVARVPDGDMPSAGFGGWYLEPTHGLDRVTERAGHLYQEAATILDRQARAGGARPLVIGGHADSVTHLLALLPHSVLADYAGSFAADPHTLTPARASELAEPVIAHWAGRRERQLVQAITTPLPGFPVAIGIDECLAAVSAEEADLLLIADDPVVPGFVCERCDVLSRKSDGCCDWGAASHRVPDLLEEMAFRTLHGGGQVISVRVLPCTAAGRLR